MAEGHDRDYGRFLVASGPYMFEGSQDLDFSVSADEQETVAGYRPGQSIILVRNPSWGAATDDLRKAYVDRIEIEIGGEENDLALKVDRGEIDLVFDGVPPAQQVQRYSTDPELEDQLHSHPSDGVRFLEMNLAEPPFDDVHVRRAVNFAVDKEVPQPAPRRADVRRDRRTHHGRQPREQPPARLPPLRDPEP